MTYSSHPPLVGLFLLSRSCRHRLHETRDVSVVGFKFAVEFQEPVGLIQVEFSYQFGR